jgi:methyltransferase family protein
MGLNELFLKYDTDKSSQVHNYAHAYERYLDPLAIKSLLEIGVAQGGSLRAWHEWCPEAEIHGIDFSDVPLVEGCAIHRGNVMDPLLLGSLGEFDVIIDDGSHDPPEVHFALEQLWPHLRVGGWYVIEDLHGSAYDTGMPLFTRTEAWEVHRHGEILFARKGPYSSSRDDEIFFVREGPFLLERVLNG